MIGPLGKLIIVEGNISAGKSTLAVGLSKITKSKLFLEPVQTNPYLKDFYAGDEFFLIDIH